MEQLVEALRQVLANTFVMYFQAHSAHWNVEGQDFKQYHDFYGEIYNSTWAATDDIAEHIRALGSLGPLDLSEMLMASSQNPTFTTTAPHDLTEGILKANEVCLVSLMVAYKAAEAAGEIGVSNFVQDRIDRHQKLGWMLRSSLK